MPEHLTKEHLKKLPSYITYSNIENGRSECENIPFYSSIGDEIQYSYPNLRSISGNILRALCYIYNKKKYFQGNFEEELCSYLYYWLGDKIYPLVQDKGVFSKIIYMIYSELYSSINEKFIVCRHVYSPIDQDRFNNNKVLFDYSKDYQNIQIDTLHGKTTCDKDYKQYIEKYISMYKKAYSDCKDGIGKNFDCDYFSKLFHKNQYDTLSSFSCIQSDMGSEFLDKQKVHEQQQTAPVQTYIQASATPPSSRHIAAQDANLGMHQYQSGKIFPGSFEPIQLDDATGSGTSKTIAGSVAPVLGVSSISLLLYKVTPLGGIIRNFLGRNRNMHNPVEYMDSFNPYSDGMVPGDRRMNISYNRL